MQTELLTALGAAGASLAGVTAAGMAGPIRQDWQGGKHPFAHRLAMIRRPAASRRGARFGGVLLALVLAGGALAAYAAEPSAPEQLPKEVVGVVGSGDQLSLEVKSADASAPRTVKIGDEYKDGWKLSGLTDTVATLNKDGQVARVGLNPAGAVAEAAPAVAVTKVTLSGSNLADGGSSAEWLAMQKSSYPNYWDGQAKPGLTLADTQRYIAYIMKSGGPNNTPAIVAALGGAGSPDADDFQALHDAMIAGVNAQAKAIYDQIGPKTVIIPAGTSVADRAALFDAAGIPTMAAKSIVSTDANGNATWTVIDPTAPRPAPKPGPSTFQFAGTVVIPRPVAP